MENKFTPQCWHAKAQAVATHLMKMSRFWTKNEIPCHQHGKQDGELELTVVTRAVVASVVLKLPMGKSGVAGDSAVTAAKSKVIINPGAHAIFTNSDQ